MPPDFPKIAPLRVRIPISHGQMTVWPGPAATRLDWLAGFPFELRPMAWDYLWISSDGVRLEIKPHYFFSTWDTFWTEPNGQVTAQALGGLFPFTLGKEAELLRGIVSVLEVLPDRVSAENPESSDKLREIFHQLREQEEPDPLEGPRPRLGRVRSRGADALWKWKLGVAPPPSRTRK
jgi:hypothetical protein